VRTPTIVRQAALRQIDGESLLTKRIDAAEVWTRKVRERTGGGAVHSSEDRSLCQCRRNGASGEHRRTDEVDLHRGHISWVSPLARALMKSEAGDPRGLQSAGRHGNT